MKPHTANAFSMSPDPRASLLVTKLFIPAPRPERVSRSRLLSQLDDGLRPGRRLILVSSPPGFGKTTLLGQWALACRTAGLGDGATGIRITWLSLDVGDNEPAYFARYLVAGLEAGGVSVSQALWDLLGASPLPPLRAILGWLINEMASLPGLLVLVLDDYHIIDAPAIHEGLAFLIDNLPPQVRLVLATRADPPLPLPRWRSRGQMVEVRTDDLRFTTGEAAELLRAMIGTDLDPEHVAALDTRTEGWAAGLQLAALSMQGRPDSVPGFVRAFSGSHHFVLDYLVEEVLERQAPDVQEFLLRTAILDRLCAPLCDVLVHVASDAPSPGRTTQEMLEHLERANLFLISLDDERRWYRYHHLFAEMLRARLKTGRPDLFTSLHCRAAEWFERQAEAKDGSGWIAQAMAHALAAHDWDRAEELIVARWIEMIFRGEIATLLHWLEALPDQRVRDSAGLGMAYCWVLMHRGEVAAIAPYLQAAERALEAQERAGSPAVAVRSLRSQLASLRSNLARLAGDLPGAIEGARQVLELAGEQERTLRASAYVGLGNAYRDMGEPGQAANAYTEAIALVRAEGNLFVEGGIVFQLARVLRQRGTLRQAELACRDALRLARERGHEGSPAFAMIWVGLGDVLVEQNRIEQAEPMVLRGLEIARHSAHLDGLRHAHLALARLRLAQGDVPRAQAALEEAVQAARQIGAPFLLRETLARRSSACVQLGRADLAESPQGASPLPLIEVETLAAARLALAQGQPGGALPSGTGIIAVIITLQ